MSTPLNNGTSLATDADSLRVTLDPSYLYIALVSYLGITLFAAIVASIVFVINFYFRRRALAAARDADKNPINVQDEDSEESSESDDSDDGGFFEEDLDDVPPPSKIDLLLRKPVQTTGGAKSDVLSAKPAQVQSELIDMDFSSDSTPLTRQPQLEEIEESPLTTTPMGQRAEATFIEPDFI